MDSIIQEKNLSLIKKIVERLSISFGLTDPKEVLWLVFGSYVTNMNNENSDVDIIGINDNFTGKQRQVLNYQKIPIHFTAITMEEFRDDGEARLYGSYFSGKIINPHIFLYGNEEYKNEAIYHAGKFIGPLAGYLGQISSHNAFTLSQVTSLVFIAYMSTDPSFDAYFLGYFVSPSFERIWQALCKDTIAMLILSESIQFVGDKYIFTKFFDNYKSFHSERMKISARHWSYGAICHDCDRKFQDKIFTKTEKRLSEIDPSGQKYKNMVLFLKEQSGLDEVYI